MGYRKRAYFNQYPGNGPFSDLPPWNDQDTHIAAEDTATVAEEDTATEDDKTLTPEHAQDFRPTKMVVGRPKLRIQTNSTSSTR